MRVLGRIQGEERWSRDFGAPIQWHRRLAIRQNLDDDASEIVLLAHWIAGAHTKLRLPKRRRGQRNAISVNTLSVDRAGFRHPKLSVIFSLMETNLDEPLRPGDLAQSVNISTWRLKRCAWQGRGVTPTLWVHQKLMKRLYCQMAVNLLFYAIRGKLCFNQLQPVRPTSFLTRSLMRRVGQCCVQCSTYLESGKLPMKRRRCFSTFRCAPIDAGRPVNLVDLTGT